MSFTDRSSHVVALEQRLLLAGPDDDLIVYYRSDITPGLYVAQSDGSNSIRIPTTATNPGNPVFTPDRSSVLFTSSISSQEGSIWIIGRNGSNETQLTNSGFRDSNARINAAGTRIVFVSNRDGNNEIYSMAPNGSDVRRHTFNAASDTDPSFSPDGTKILFVTDRFGNDEIVTIDFETGLSLTRLTDNAEDDRSPTYSPEGTRIAFESYRDSGFLSIWTMSAAGEIAGPDPVLLRVGADFRTEGDPSYSPDGTLLAISEGSVASNIIRIIDVNTGFSHRTFTNQYASSPNWASTSRFSGLSGSTVIIFGTEGPDTITLALDEGEVTFTRNGVTEEYPLDWVLEMQIFCGGGNDTLLGDASPVKFYAIGDGGDDVMVGGNFNDTLSGGSGRNTIFGGNGDDRLNGSNGRDFVYGDGGNDRLYGNGGNDYMLGGGNIDRMWGGAGDDFLAGNGQNDKLFGEDGNDEIYGNDGNDILYGGLNTDILNGGKGFDNADDDDGDTRSAIEQVA